MLLSYFGEHADHDCGQCDVCLARKKTETSRASDVQTAIQTITAFLGDGQEHRLMDLKSLPIQTPVFDEALQYMMGEEMLVVEGMKIWLNSED
jgi:ATP-dependent DNA helicase RecQ